MKPRRLCFVLGPTGHVIWFVIDQDREILRYGYVRQG
jgi:hypothetical protein